MKTIWTVITYAFLVAATIGFYAHARWGPDHRDDHVLYTEPALTVEPTGWFQQVRPYCNAVEAETAMRRTPPPADYEGQAHAAACWALAGEIDRARSVIQALPQPRQWEAASVVFGVGHPVADAGDDIAAGPLMELVVEFWSNNYMALYHAGAARYERGDAAGAAPYLERFLEHYSQEDGWTRSARKMLEG